MDIPEEDYLGPAPAHEVEPQGDEEASVAEYSTGCSDSPDEGPTRRRNAGGSTRRRRRRPAWSQLEEAILAKQHSLRGNAWSAIAEHLPGRSAAEVKNIWHSTLRSKRLKARSLLRAYARLIYERGDGPTARQEAFRLAVRLARGEEDKAQLGKSLGPKSLRQPSADSDADDLYGLLEAAPGAGLPGSSDGDCAASLTSHPSSPTRSALDAAGALAAARQSDLKRGRAGAPSADDPSGDAAAAGSRAPRQAAMQSIRGNASVAAGKALRPPGNRADEPTGDRHDDGPGGDFERELAGGNDEPSSEGRPATGAAEAEPPRQSRPPQRPKASSEAGPQQPTQSQRAKAGAAARAQGEGPHRGPPRQHERPRAWSSGQPPDEGAQGPDLSGLLPGIAGPGGFQMGGPEDLGSVLTPEVQHLLYLHNMQTARQRAHAIALEVMPPWLRAKRLLEEETQAEAYRFLLRQHLLQRAQEQSGEAGDAGGAKMKAEGRGREKPVGKGRGGGASQVSKGSNPKDQEAEDQPPREQFLQEPSAAAAAAMTMQGPGGAGGPLGGGAGGPLGPLGGLESLGPLASLLGAGGPLQGAAMAGLGIPGMGLTGAGLAGLGIPGAAMAGMGLGGAGLPGMGVGLTGAGIPGIAGLSGLGLPGGGMPGGGMPGSGMPNDPALNPLASAALTAHGFDVMEQLNVFLDRIKTERVMNERLAAAAATQAAAAQVAAAQAAAVQAAAAQAAAAQAAAVQAATAQAAAAQVAEAMRLAGLQPWEAGAGAMEAMASMNLLLEGSSFSAGGDSKIGERPGTSPQAPAPSARTGAKRRAEHRDTGGRMVMTKSDSQSGEPSAKAQAQGRKGEAADVGASGFRALGWHPAQEEADAREEDEEEEDEEEDEEEAPGRGGGGPAVAQRAHGSGAAAGGSGAVGRGREQNRQLQLPRWQQQQMSFPPLSQRQSQQQRLHEPPDRRESAEFGATIGDVAHALLAFSQRTTLSDGRGFASASVQAASGGGPNAARKTLLR